MNQFLGYNSTKVNKIYIKAIGHILVSNFIWRTSHNAQILLFTATTFWVSWRPLVLWTCIVRARPHLAAPIVAFFFPLFLSIFSVAFHYRPSLSPLTDWQLFRLPQPPTVGEEKCPLGVVKFTNSFFFATLSTSKNPPRFFAENLARSRSTLAEKMSRTENPSWN